MDTLEERPVSMPEVSEILKKKEKEYSNEGVDLLYEQRRALEHSAKFKKISVKDSMEMTKKLQELDILLSNDRIVKIIDLMPSSVDDIRAIFAKERFKYTEEEINKITDIVDQYR